jgi:hypothetical protein
MPQYGSKRDWEQTPREASQPALDCKQSCPSAATRRMDAQCQSQVTLHDLIWFTPRGSSNDMSNSSTRGESHNRGCSTHHHGSSSRPPRDPRPASHARRAEA